MYDAVMKNWLRSQYEAGMELAACSDIFELVPMAGDPPFLYEARFKAPCRIRTGSGPVWLHEGFTVAIVFPPEYLRKAHAATSLAFVGPPNVWHPNIMPPGMCIGQLRPGTGIQQLIYRVYELATWQRYMPNEFDALNKAACAWAREEGLANGRVKPTCTLPLKRRAAEGVVNG